ncbi:MAG: serine/threonine-protein phosphatase [Clostridia bacterium]|nr:serine/threonine-protein phosphatase [Clostridia bacterium]
MKKMDNSGMNNRNFPEGSFGAGETSIGVEMRLAPGASIYIKTGNCQNRGARNYQEDSFGYSNIVSSDVVSNKGLFAVLSDGMGGLTNGKEVADYVVQTSISLFEALNPTRKISTQLEKIAESINENVCAKYGAGATSKAGATLVIAFFFKNRIYWVAVGDSRLYCYRNGYLFQMNEDHDYKNKLFRRFIDDRGKLETAFKDPQRDSLVSFVGKKDLPEIDVSLKGYKIMPGDIYVLCSDGIYNAINQDLLKNHLVRYDAQVASEQIVSSVLDARLPGQDNMTVMVIKCGRK